MVTKFLHTRYRVEDLEATLDFYLNVIGLQEVRRHTSPRGSTLVFLKAPESEELLEICHYPDSGPVEVGFDITHIAFSVKDLDVFGAHIMTLGHAFSDGPHDTDNSRFAFVDAPEGYEVEIIQQKASE